MTMFNKNTMILLIVITLCALVNNCICMSVGVLSKGHNFSKRETGTSDFYPDWVPFKNKKGEELGEFTEVTHKSNVKKRLALPANFRFSAIETPYDYFDKIGSEGEDYFEKRDWSDLNRAPVLDDKKTMISHKELEHIDGIMLKVNPEIVTKTTTVKPSVHDFNENTRSEEKHSLPNSDLPKVESSIVPITSQKTAPTHKIENKSGEERAIVKKPPKYEDEIEYEDGYSTKIKKKTNEIVDSDEKENNERRHKILDLVDDLREHHEAEQRVISEKMKEEELSREEHDNNYGSIGYDKYSSPVLRRKLPLTFEEYDELGPSEDKYKVPREIISSSSTSSIILPITTTPTTTTTQKYRKKSHIVETGKLSFFRNPSLFMVYDDQDSDEFPDSVRAIQNVTTTESDYPTSEITTSSTTAPKSTTPLETDKTTTTTEQYVYTAPWNPHLPEHYDNIFNVKPTEAPERKTARISLVPVSPNHDDSGPALFFPKPRKVKPKSKSISKASFPEMEASQSSALDISGPQYISDMLPSSSDNPQSTRFGSGTSEFDAAISGPTYIEHTSTNFTGKEPEPFSTGKSNLKIIGNKAIYRGSNDKHIIPSSVVKAPSALDSIPSAADTAPSAVDTAPSAVDAASSVDNSSEPDAVPAPSQSKAEEHKPKNHEHESGGGHEHESEHEGEKSEHGKKAYEGFLKDSKSGKGHHNKEDHLGKYHDHGGFDKHHHDESGHQGEHIHEEHGKKHAQYEESGKHSKGHSTKGSHDIHKKDEYEKNVEFFEEEGDSTEEEKHGGYHKDKEHKKGGSFMKGIHDSARERLKKGETGRYEKLLNQNKHQGHKEAFGHDSHGKRGKATAVSNSGGGGKHWIYHHGYPPKNANLVLIDRRDGFLPVHNVG